MVYFYTKLKIMVLLSHLAMLIFRSDNHLEDFNGNWEDNLEEGCVGPDFCCSYILSNPYLDYMAFKILYKIGYMPD